MKISDIKNIVAQSENLVENNQIELAVKLLEQALCDYPPSFYIFYNLARCYDLKGETVLAIQFYQKALERNYFDKNSIIYLSIALNKNSQNLEAVTILNLYLAKHSEDIEARQLLASLQITKPLQVSNYVIEKKRIPCHLRQLFINHDGDVFPCCRKWNDKNSKIGHVGDVDIYSRIINYDYKCECDRFILIKNEDSKQTITGMNLEFSLACNGKCAMCCVGAPEWHGKYDYYQDIKKLIDLCKPASLLLQGGEVLFQKRTMEWLKLVKREYPQMLFHLITNGCFAIDIITDIEFLFENIMISIVGFEDHTYKTIMGLDLATTMKFAEEIINRTRIKVSLKYLCTPLNLHQAGLFLDWAAKICPAEIQIVDSNLKSYLKFDTFDSYWEKIFNRTGIDLKNRLLKNKAILLKENTQIRICKNIKEMLDISDGFLTENCFSNIIPSY